jgi:uncharacterized protein
MLKTIRWRWPALALLAGAFFAGCAGLDTPQRKWIFNSTRYATPWSQFDADRAQDVWIEHRSAATGTPVKLHGLWFAHQDAQAPLLLYLHGAGRNVHASAFRIEHMRELGFSVLAIDYRGFGRSTAELPSEAMVYEDAKAAWNWLAEQHPGRARYVFGHSLGGAIAIHLASEVDDVRGLMVEGTFTSIPEVFQTMKWGWLPVTALITQRFESVAKIEKVKAPLLIVHGSRDRLIQPSLGQALYDRAKGKKKFVLVEGGTHYTTNSMGRPQYREALKELFGIGS